jgi:membrane dipeptidase
MNRRQFIASAGAIAAAAWLTPAGAQARSLRFADMHSHIGMRAAARIRDAMSTNGMLVVARKIVADAPVIRALPGKGYRMVREPGPGELAQRFDEWVARLRRQHQAEGLPEIVSAAALERALRDGQPAVVLAAEGGDFLEGNMSRLEQARAKGLVHLQLVHYRVSELGDISTEQPVHGGLTPFGREVVAACNRLGILIDIAHGTAALIEQALELAAKPIVYSHGHVTASEPHWTQNPLRARAIHKPLALKVAQRGGVVGIWPIGAMFRSLDAYANALMDAAEALGAAHVGIGTDMAGLSSSVIPDYEAFPALEALLAKRGVRREDIDNMLGRNYLRVLRQALAG